MASTIKVDEIRGSTGSTVVFPAGQTVTITDGLTVAGGGTGLASFTAGDVLYATGSTTLAKLPKGTAEQVLAMNAGATAPDWGSVDLTVLPTISVAKGGTGQAGGFTAGDILYATGATTLAKLAKGTAAQQIAMNAGATAPEWVTPASGALAVISTANITGSSVSEIAFDGLFDDATYRAYKIIGNIKPTSSAYIQIRFNVAGSAVTSDSYTGTQNITATSHNGSGAISYQWGSSISKYPSPASSPYNDRIGLGVGSYNFGNPIVTQHSREYMNLDFTVYPDTTGTGNTFDSTVMGNLTYGHYGIGGVSSSCHYGTAIINHAGKFWGRQLSRGVVTGITLYPNTGSWDVGSNVILYGVKR